MKRVGEWVRCLNAVAAGQCNIAVAMLPLLLLKLVEWVVAGLVLRPVARPVLALVG